MRSFICQQTTNYPSKYTDEEKKKNNESTTSIITSIQCRKFIWGKVKIKLSGLTYCNQILPLSFIAVPWERCCVYFFSFFSLLFTIQLFVCCFSHYFLLFEINSYVYISLVPGIVNQLRKSFFFFLVLAYQFYNKIMATWKMV